MTLAQEAVVATTRATRARQAGDVVPGSFDLSRIKNIVARAFQPEVASRLTGKAVLWVDDSPDNNHYEATALRKMGLVIDQVVSTEAALAELLGRDVCDREPRAYLYAGPERAHSLERIAVIPGEIAPDMEAE